MDGGGADSACDRVRAGSAPGFRCGTGSARRKPLRSTLSSATGCIRRAFRDNTINPAGVPPVTDLNYRGKWLQLLFTVDDPSVFTTPWSATVTYGPQTLPPKGLGAWPEYICAENPYKYGTEEYVPVPKAKLADF